MCGRAAVLVAIVLLISGTQSESKKAKHNRKPKTENQTLTPWEYCEGCKVTVDLYANLALQGMQDMQKNGIKDGEVFAAEKVVEGMCDNVHFNEQFIPAMKWGCIKVTSENLTKFLDPWAGSASAATMGTKSNVFDIKKEVSLLA